MEPRPNVLVRLRRIAVLLAVVGGLVASAFAAGATGAGSAAVVVDATITTATSLDTSGCVSGGSDTQLGTLLPGASVVTSTDCDVAFSTSNSSTARLSIAQRDGGGSALVAWTDGADDTSFSTDGRVTTNVASGVAVDAGRAVAVQPDGAVVVAGYCAMGGATGQDMCAARFTSSGALDATFGTGGVVTVAIAPGAAADDARAMLLQPDGKIVLGGRCTMGGATGIDICVVRLTTTGALDPTFGTGGIRIVAASASTDDTRALALQGDGRIVVGGYCSGTSFNSCVTRLWPDGSLDLSFGTAGTVVTDWDPANQDVVYALAIQPDGAIIAAGYCGFAGTGFDGCVARYLPNGTLDPAFSGDGMMTIVQAPAAGNDYFVTAGLAGDGGVLVAGGCAMAGATGDDTCIAKIRSDGTLDPAFGTAGVALQPLATGAGADIAYGMYVQPDGKFVTSGNCDQGASGYDICVARFRSDGSLDPAFGSSGILRTSMAPGAGIDYGLAVSEGRDGGIAVAGYCDMAGTTGQDFCIALLDGGATVPQYADGSADWDTPSAGHFGACLRAVSSATATWTANATCPASDGAWWNDVPGAAEQLAYTTSAGTVGTASVRFGARIPSTQSPAVYDAALVFSVSVP